MKGRIAKIVKENLVYIPIFIILIATCWHFINGFNTYDTYKMFDLGYETYAKSLFFADGRIFSGIYILIANSFHIFQTDLHKISICICICIVAYTIIYFKNIIIKIYDKQINIYLIYLLSFITIFNFAYLDIMRFIEMPIIALSVLFYIIAAEEIVIKENNIKALIYLILAVFMYQGTINVFAIILLFLYMQKYKVLYIGNIKDLIKKSLICIIPILMNFMFIKIYGKLFIHTDRISVKPNRVFNMIYKVISDVLVYSKMRIT